MKKRILWLLIAAVLGTTACSGSNTTENKENTVEDNKDAAETKKDDNSDEQKQGKENTEHNSVKVLVYYPNENADGTDTEEMECKELSAENILSLLKGKGVVAENAEINNFQQLIKKK